MDRLGGEGPRWIGGYRLLGRLGQGRLGHVYLARGGQERMVAIRRFPEQLARQDEFRRRLRQEIRAALRAGGGSGASGLAPLLDADTEADAPWLATGYITGPSLREVVSDHGPLPERSVRILAAGLARALLALHRGGVVHRDLKPSNVLLTIDGPRVIDYGIAGALPPEHAGAGPPSEHAGANVAGHTGGGTEAEDVYDLGTVLAYAATGQPELPEAVSGKLSDELRELIEGLLAHRTEVGIPLAELPARAEVGQGIDQNGIDPDEPWLPPGLIATLARHDLRTVADEGSEVDTAEESVESSGSPTLTANVATLPHRAPSNTPWGTPSEPHPWHSLPTVDGTPLPQGPPPAPPAPSSAPPPAARRRGRRATVLTALLVVVLAVGGGAAYVLLGNGDERQGRSGPRAGQSGSTVTTGPDGPSAPSDGSNTTGSPGREVPSTSRTEAAGAVPEDFLGSWERSFGADGADDTIRLEVAQGEVGDTVLTIIAEGPTYRCVFRADLRDPGPPVALGTSRVTEMSSERSCEPGPTTQLELTADGKLRRVFADGRPPGLFSRA